MRQLSKRSVAFSPCLLMASALLMLANPAMADKPGGHGAKNKVDRQQAVAREQHDALPGHRHDTEREKKHGGNPKKGKHTFADHDRDEVRRYYTAEFQKGNCPPGLAKKGNGCQPPGLAKRWAVGRPLPPDVTIYELPAVVVDMIGPPPIGQRYVRVANDILMIADGTSMVIDAIQDLGK